MEFFVSSRLAIVLFLAVVVIGVVPFAAAYLTWWSPWCNVLAGFFLTVVSGLVLFYEQEAE